MFCRNVLIYFDQETKVGVLERIARVTERDGYLVLGAAETVVGLTDVSSLLPTGAGSTCPILSPRRVGMPRLALVGRR